MEINVFIPAAGLGTRLLPLTANKPKALVEISGKPMICLVLDKLLYNSNLKIDKVIVNVHHFSSMLKDFLLQYKNHEILISDETNLILDTGGGLKQALSLLDAKPLLVHNVDIYTNYNYEELVKEDFDETTLAKLVVSNRKSSRNLLFNSQMQLSGWENKTTGEKILTRNAEYSFAFSGIQLVNPEILPFFTSDNVFPLIPEYLRLSSKHNFKGLVSNTSFFEDLGK